MTAGQKKVFIVDDDTFLLDMYSLKFSQSGYTVESALGPEAALEKLKSGYTPEVMLLDVVMPTMNGFQTEDNSQILLVVKNLEQRAIL